MLSKALFIFGELISPPFLRFTLLSSERYYYGECNSTHRDCGDVPMPAKHTYIYTLRLQYTVGLCA